MTGVDLNIAVKETTLDELVAHPSAMTGVD